MCICIPPVLSHIEPQIQMPCLAHRDTAAVARFFARRRCFRRSAGSSMAVRSGAGFFRLRRLSPLPLGSVGSVLVLAACPSEPDDLQAATAQSADQQPLCYDLTCPRRQAQKDSSVRGAL